jgi:hypothetical protein
MSAVFVAGMERCFAVKQKIRNLCLVTKPPRPFSHALMKSMKLYNIKHLHNSFLLSCFSFCLLLFLPLKLDFQLRVVYFNIEIILMNRLFEMLTRIKSTLNTLNCVVDWRRRMKNQKCSSQTFFFILFIMQLLLNISSLENGKAIFRLRSFKTNFSIFSQKIFTSKYCFCLLETTTHVFHHFSFWFSISLMKKHAEYIYYI